MRCWKCGSYMKKDSCSRTAYCPGCGRIIVYRTKSDKKQGRKGPYFFNNNSKSRLRGCLDGCMFWLLKIYGRDMIIVMILVLVFVAFCYIMSRVMGSG